MAALELQAAVDAVLEFDMEELGRNIDRAKSVFQKLRSAANKGATALARSAKEADEGDPPPELLGELPEDAKAQLLEFVVAVAAKVKMYRNLAVSILKELLCSPGSSVADTNWRAVAVKDRALLEKLRDLDAKVAALFQEAEPVATPANMPTAVPETRDSAAANASGYPQVDERPLAREPQVAASPTVVAEVDATAGYEDNSSSFCNVAPPARQKSSDSTGSAPKVVVDNASPSSAEAGKVETRRMLYSALEAMNAIDYEVDSRHLDEAMSAFHNLRRGVNRAAHEHERLSRAIAMGEEPDREIEDMIASSANGCSWEPSRVLMFLFHLKKARPIYERHIDSVARTLPQISPPFRDAAFSSDLLRRWLGVCTTSNEAARVVTYRFASMLRWAAWDCGMHRSRYRERCLRRISPDEDEERWERGRKELFSSTELPKTAIEGLLKGVWLAAEHCSYVRLEQKRALFGVLLSKVTGADEDHSSYKDEWEKHMAEMQREGSMKEQLLSDLRWMVWNICWFTANKVKGYHEDARSSLVRAERHFHRAFRGEVAWRGVNLGGWFLLEPGPCTTFWESLPPQARATCCEWDCCAALGPDKEQVLSHHRNTYFSKEDFAQIRAAGLTHVRLPIGHWCVTGPRPGEPYVGPCLDLLDQALNLLEESGLRVVLDLHGCVGGESGDAPCGRKWDSWRPKHFDLDASLAVLKTIAERYAQRMSVCGIGICNEPSEQMSLNSLMKYYVEAVRTIRQAGMRPGEVAIILPVFTEWRLSTFMDHWEANYRAFEDCVLDVHLYQSFGRYWCTMSLDQHMKEAEKRASLLERMPACCVSEWSLSLPDAATGGQPAPVEILRRFGQLQLQAYEGATHGWFFWTWKDSAGLAWSLQESLQQEVLTVPGGGRSSTLLNP